MELTTTATTIVDDPIKRMTWSLQPDNTKRYPQRFKMVLDYMGFTKTEDEDKGSLRRGAIEFMKEVERHPGGVEDKLMDFSPSINGWTLTGPDDPIRSNNGDVPHTHC
ncbi:MAG: hypothetical protein WB988_17125 [Candidatus Nitrosopolaris sp.]